MDPTKCRIVEYTPGDTTLYHADADTAGQAHTFDVGDQSVVSIYAEADDNSQPVQPATVETPAS